MNNTQNVHYTQNVYTGKINDKQNVHNAYHNKLKIYKNKRYIL